MSVVSRRLLANASVGSAVVLGLVGVMAGSGIATTAIGATDGITWLGNSDDGSILEYNPATNEVDNGYKVGAPGENITVEQRDGVLIVTNHDTGEVTVIDGSTMEPGGSRELPSGPGSKVLASNGASYVVDTGAGTVTRMDPKNADDVGTAWSADRPIEDAVVDGEGAIWVSGPDGVSEVVWDSREKKLVERNFQRAASDGGTRLTGHHPRGATLVAPGMMQQLGTGTGGQVQDKGLTGPFEVADETESSSLVPVAQPQSGSVSLLSNGKLVNVSTQELQCSEPTTPATYQNVAYVVCAGQNQVLRLTPEGEPAGPPVPTPGEGDAELVWDEDRLVMNVSGSEEGIVVGRDGEPRPFDRSPSRAPGELGSPGEKVGDGRSVASEDQGAAAPEDGTEQAGELPDPSGPEQGDDRESSGDELPDPVEVPGPEPEREGDQGPELPNPPNPPQAPENPPSDPGDNSEVPPMPDNPPNEPPSREPSNGNGPPEDSGRGPENPGNDPGPAEDPERPEQPGDEGPGDQPDPRRQPEPPSEGPTEEPTGPEPSEEPSDDPSEPEPTESQRPTDPGPSNEPPEEEPSDEPTDPEPEPTESQRPTDPGPSNEPTDEPSEPEPTSSESEPEPSDSPTQPEPSDTPTQPEPSDTPTQPEPSDTPTQPEPSDTPSQSEPSSTPTDPAPSNTPSEPEPSNTPSEPEPSSTPTSTTTNEPTEPEPSSTATDPSPTGPTELPPSTKPTPTMPTDEPPTTEPTPTMPTEEPSPTTEPSPTESTEPSPTESTEPSPTETSEPSPTETSEPTPTETASPTPTGPATPEWSGSNFEVTGTTETSISVSWPEANDAVEYEATVGKRVVPVSGTKTTFEDLEPGTTYDLKVVAVNSDGSEEAKSEALTTSGSTKEKKPEKALTLSQGDQLTDPKPDYCSTEHCGEILASGEGFEANSDVTCQMNSSQAGGPGDFEPKTFTTDDQGAFSNEYAGVHGYVDDYVWMECGDTKSNELTWEEY